MRSRRVALSPRVRRNSVSASGPPKLASIRLPAVLSLWVMAAAQISSDGHALGTGTAFGNGRMFDDVGGAENDAPVELLLANVDPLQHQRGGQHLEGAAQGEAFMLALPNMSPVFVSRMTTPRRPCAAASISARRALMSDGRRLGARLRDLQGGDGESARQDETARDRCRHSHSSETTMAGTIAPGHRSEVANAG